jgi:adenine phosphoribosyltransferase
MKSAKLEVLKTSIRDVPDFPKQGIIFKDITTLLKEGKYLQDAVQLMIDQVKNAEFDAIASIESRGFIFGPAMAVQMGKGFIPIRKPGKLPAKTVSEKYELEYGFDSVEIHADAVKKDDKILIVDDLLATGGTALASVKLIEKLGGFVSGLSFLIELEFLEGRKKFADYQVYSLISY